MSACSDLAKTGDMVCLIIPIQNAASRIGSILRDWHDGLNRLNIDHTFLIVDDGSQDETWNVLERLRERYTGLRTLRHDSPRGFGACLRTALPEILDPLVGYVTLDYPYRPADLEGLLGRLNQPVEVYGTVSEVGVASGCRTGRPVPGAWKVIGRLYRGFVRLALGYKPEPLAGWLGIRNHWRSWWLWLSMGVPLVDITSGLKIFRRHWFERFPIQSDGDFAHAEILAKLTFLGAMIAEVPLQPRNDVIPPTTFTRHGAVFRNAKFHPTSTMMPSLTGSEN